MAGVMLTAVAKAVGSLVCNDERALLGHVLQIRRRGNLPRGVGGRGIVGVEARPCDAARLLLVAALGVSAKAAAGALDALWHIQCAGGSLGDLLSDEVRDCVVEGRESHFDVLEVVLWSGGASARVVNIDGDVVFDSSTASHGVMSTGAIGRLTASSISATAELFCEAPRSADVVTEAEVSPEVSERETYTMSEMQVLLGVGRNQVYEAAKRGDFPTIRVGSRVFAPKRHIHRMLGINRAA